MRLYAALSEQQGDLGRWYHGALVVWTDSANPERIHQAAHSLREVMEKLPRFIGAPTPTKQPSQTAKLNEMRNAWEASKGKTSCYENDRWTGTIDGHLRKALGAVDGLIAWMTESRPHRRSAVRSLLGHLDASGRPLPQSVEDRQAEDWENMWDYFVNACHHRRPTDAAEFAGMLRRFEQFVLDRLRPKTAEEMATLDALIAGAERGA